MHKYCKPFRDVMVAPGSQLFEALEANDLKRAHRLYTDCEIKRRLSEGERPERVYYCTPDGLTHLYSDRQDLLAGYTGPIYKSNYGTARVDTP